MTESALVLLTFSIPKWCCVLLCCAVVDPLNNKKEAELGELRKSNLFPVSHFSTYIRRGKM